MNPIVKYGAAVAAVLGVLYGAYHHGVSTTQAKADLVVAQLNQDIADQRTTHAKQLTEAVTVARNEERKSAADMAAIDAKLLKESQDREAISNSTIADLRSGASSLRDKFTTCQRRADSGTGAACTSTSSGHDAASIQLQSEDAEFLILFAKDADRVADQLRACQAVVVADRKGQSKPHQ